MTRLPLPPESILDGLEPYRVIDGRKTWRSKDGKRFYQWDSLHGEIEVYDARGWHLGVMDVNGRMLCGATRGRRIHV